VRLRAQRHHRTEIARPRTHHRDDAGEIRREGIALGKLDGLNAGRVEPRKIAIAVDGVPADPRIGRKQQPQLGAHELPGADQKDRSGLQVEKDRQIAHTHSAAPKLRG